MTARSLQATALAGLWLSDVNGAISLNVRVREFFFTPPRKGWSGGRRVLYEFCQNRIELPLRDAVY